MTHAWITRFCLLLSALALPGPELLAQEQARSRFVTREVARAPVHPKIVTVSFVLSPDVKRLAYVVIPGKRKAFVIVDGEEGPEYGGIVAGYPRFGPDGTRLAYVAMRGGKWLVVVDGQEGPEFDGIVGSRLDAVYFSPDGKHVAYDAWRGRKRFVVIDGQEDKGYDPMKIGSGHITRLAMNPFSPDGRRIAYVARRAKREFVTADGQEGPEFDYVHYPFFSADSRHIAYEAKQGEQWSVVLDGRELRGARSPAFSSNGTRFAYVAMRGARQFVVVDGQEGPAYHRVGHPILFSPDGTRLSYVATRDTLARTVPEWERRLPRVVGLAETGEFVVVDGQEGPVFDDVDGNSIIFSPDGRRVAARAKRGEEWHVVMDGQVGPQYDMVVGPTFSPDSRRVVHDARRGEKWLVVVNGQESPEYEDLHHRYFFSPDGGRMAYVARRGGKSDAFEEFTRPDGSVVLWEKVEVGGRLLLVVDGQEGQEYDKVLSPVFAPDSRRIAYAAQRGGKWRMVVEGVEGREYDDLLPPVFCPDGGHVAYLAFRGNSSFVVIDDDEGEAYDAFPGLAGREARLAWDGNHVLHAVMVRNNEFVRVEIGPE